MGKKNVFLFVGLLGLTEYVVGDVNADATTLVVYNDANADNITVIKGLTTKTI